MNTKTLLLLGGVAALVAIIIIRQRASGGAPAVAAAVEKNKADAIAPAEPLSIDVDIGEPVLMPE